MISYLWFTGDKEEAWGKAKGKGKGGEGEGEGEGEGDVCLSTDSIQVKTFSVMCDGVNMKTYSLSQGSAGL
jgi:hypothetical protein